MKTLEMIMVRKNEQIGGFIAFLDSVFTQRNIDRKDFRVTLVQMDSEDSEDNDTMTELKKYPFEVNVLHTGCQNYSQAKNAALSNAKAKWLMFMDYADIFPDVYSMSMILNLIPSDEWDILWMQQYVEYMLKDGRLFINVVGDNDVSTNGKVFRLAYLNDHGVTFDENLTHDEGRVFFQTAISMTDYTRFGKIATKFIPYCHTWRDEDINLREIDILFRQHEMNIATVNSIGAHVQNDHFIGAIMKTICDAYHFLNVETPMKGIHELELNVADFYHKYAPIIDRVKKQDVEIVLDDSQKDMINLIQHAYRVYGYELYFATDRIPFRKWLDKIARIDPGKVRSLHIVPDAPVSKEDKVAVFCGTRNVYDCMETAAKSLMAHTKMDRIYFFIEDNTFPNPLPDIVRCVNVSDQQWFPENGRNYNNAWTYMCMIRAAFAKLMPDEHKVLSLDIDVVVNEDISELWDIDMSDYYLAGVSEPEHSAKLKNTYINFGVVMMNLDKIRNDGIDDTVIASLNRDRWGCPEQECFNHFCKPHILALDPMYNVVRVAHITGESDREKISHYAGIKYWKHFTPFRRYAKASWDDILTGNINDITREDEKE